jgi:hypothetical protein
MTFQKIGTEFWDECAAANLSDAAVRTHAEALGWISRVEAMDMRIPKHLVRRFTGSDDWTVGVKELVATGFWRDDGDAYTVLHHADVTRSGLVAQRKKRDRDKQAQRVYRAKKVIADVSAGVIGDAVSLSVYQSGTGTSTDGNEEEVLEGPRDFDASRGRWS